MQRKRREAGGMFPKIPTNSWKEGFVLHGVDGGVPRRRFAKWVKSPPGSIFSPAASQLRR